MGFTGKCDAATRRRLTCASPRRGPNPVDSAGSNCRARHLRPGKDVEPTALSFACKIARAGRCRPRPSTTAGLHLDLAPGDFLPQLMHGSDRTGDRLVLSHGLTFSPIVRPCRAPPPDGDVLQESAPPRAPRCAGSAAVDRVVIAPTAGRPRRCSVASEACAALSLATSSRTSLPARSRATTQPHRRSTPPRDHVRPAPRPRMVVAMDYAVARVHRQRLWRPDRRLRLKDRIPCWTSESMHGHAVGLFHHCIVDRRPLCRRRLSVEFGQLPVPRRRAAEGTGALSSRRWPAAEAAVASGQTDLGFLRLDPERSAARRRNRSTMR